MSNFRPLFHAASSLFLVPPVQSSCKKSESADAAAAVWCPFAAPHCAFVSRVGPPRQGCRCCQNPKEHIFGFSARIPPLTGVALAPSPIRNTHRHRHRHTTRYTLVQHPTPLTQTQTQRHTYTHTANAVAAFRSVSPNILPLSLSRRGLARSSYLPFVLSPFEASQPALTPRHDRLCFFVICALPFFILSTPSPPTLRLCSHAGPAFTLFTLHPFPLRRAQQILGLSIRALVRSHWHSPRRRLQTLKHCASLVSIHQRRALAHSHFKSILPATRRPVPGSPIHLLPQHLALS